MWRLSSASRLVRKSLTGVPTRLSTLWPASDQQQQPRLTLPWAHPSSSASSTLREGNRSEESMTFAEAKRLMKLANVDALKRRLGMESEEVIGYSKLLEACEGIGVARNKEEAKAFARVLDEAGVVLLFRDRVYLHPEKFTKLGKSLFMNGSKRGGRPFYQAFAAEEFVLCSSSHWITKEV